MEIGSATTGKDCIIFLGMVQSLNLPLELRNIQNGYEPLESPD